MVLSLSSRHLKYVAMYSTPIWSVNVIGDGGLRVSGIWICVYIASA